MTAVNATVAPDAVWLSTDSAITAGMRCDLMATAARVSHGGEISRVEREPGTPPPEIAGHLCKVWSWPERRLIMAGTGALSMIHGVGTGLSAVSLGGLDSTVEELPDALGGAAEALPGQPILILLAGWSEREDRALAFAFASGDGFEPCRIDRGHSITPYPPALSSGTRSLWTMSAHGGDALVEGFHRRLAEDQAAWARERGIAAIGGMLRLAKVDRGGVALRTIGTLD